MSMTPACQHEGIWRLKNAPWPSPTTAAAVRLLQQCSSDESLLAALKDPHHASSALEVFCALRSRSEDVYAAVRSAIDGCPCLCWSLIESLNRLPWHGGVRAFLSLPGHPTTSACAYPFYILARNKVFLPADMSGSLYECCVHGLWGMLHPAKAGDWHQVHPSSLKVIDLLHAHLERSDPDLFVVYFSALMLGEIGPMEASIRGLERRLREPCHPRVQGVAALALACLDDHHGHAWPCQPAPAIDLSLLVRCAVNRVAVVPG
jgi:hypothetical protein